MDTKQTIEILLVDDYAPIRKSLRILLTSVPGVEVIGEAEDGRIKGLWVRGDHFCYQNCG